MSSQQLQTPMPPSRVDASSGELNPNGNGGQPQPQPQPQLQLTSHAFQTNSQTGSPSGISGTNGFSDVNFPVDDFFCMPTPAGGSGASYLETAESSSYIGPTGFLDGTHTIPTALPYFPDEQSSRPESSSPTQTVSADDLAVLHDNYFTTIYHALPWLDQERFVAELALTPDSLPLLSLSYGIALIGCTISPQYDHLQQPCYHMARKYAEECERDEEDGNLASLNLFQALLFIIRYEIRGRRPLRAWVTIGRAIRLSRILGLHQMDCEATLTSELSELRSHLAPTDDELLLEERRRSFWALYMVCLEKPQVP